MVMRYEETSGLVAVRACEGETVTPGFVGRLSITSSELELIWCVGKWGLRSVVGGVAGLVKSS